MGNRLGVLLALFIVFGLIVILIGAAFNEFNIIITGLSATITGIISFFVWPSLM